MENCDTATAVGPDTGSTLMLGPRLGPSLRLARHIANSHRHRPHGARHRRPSWHIPAHPQHITLRSALRPSWPFFARLLALADLTACRRHVLKPPGNMEICHVTCAQTAHHGRSKRTAAALAMPHARLPSAHPQPTCCTPRPVHCGRENCGLAGSSPTSGYGSGSLLGGLEATTPCMADQMCSRSYILQAGRCTMTQLRLKSLQHAQLRKSPTD